MTKEIAKVKPGQVVAQRSEIFDTRTVVATLEGLMTRVTADKVTPETVNAACNCADRIVDMLRLHLDVERLDRKMGRARGEER